MSFNTDLKMAYHMGYDDALAKRKPDASKVHMLMSGTCRMIHSSEYVECKLDEFKCSECGWSGAIDNMTVEVKHPRFCPNCGRVVVGDD